MNLKDETSSFFKDLTPAAQADVLKSTALKVGIGIFLQDTLI